MDRVTTSAFVDAPLDALIDAALDAALDALIDVLIHAFVGLFESFSRTNLFATNIFVHVLDQVALS
ncbi:MAG: hypothetical protein GKR90_18375 [Pseudomonadales bacterium]|nr:hypothetical protein [Pseudomonadales bacterium]